MAQEAFQDIRQAVRALCSDFPPAYWQRIDDERGYPEEFVRALAEVKKKSEGLSVFLVDIRASLDRGLTLRPIRDMVNHETNEAFFEDLEIENLIGEEGKGFKWSRGSIAPGSRTAR